MDEKAGEVYVRWGMYEDAAHCYLKAKVYDKAGENFELVSKYTDAVVAYKDGGFYEKVIDLIQR